MREMNLSIRSKEHSIDGMRARPTPKSKAHRHVSKTSSYVNLGSSTEILSIDVSGCTDMHGYGMRTILYPYDPKERTRGGRRARDTVK